MTLDATPPRAPKFYSASDLLEMDDLRAEISRLRREASTLQAELAQWKQSTAQLRALVERMTNQRG